MGLFTKVFGKTTSVIMNFISTKTADISKKSANKQHSYLSASIGDVLNNLLTENDIGDKVVITQKSNNSSENKETKTEINTQKTPEVTNENNIKEEIKLESKIKTESDTPKISKTIKEQKLRDDIKTEKNFQYDKYTNNTVVTKDELNKIRDTLKDKCIKSGISFGEIAIHLSAIVGKNFQDFNKLDNRHQKMILTYVIQSIDNVNRVNLPDVNKLHAVITDAALMYEFVTHDETGKIIDLENISPEELIKRREIFNEKLRKRRESKMAQIEGLPKAEKEEAEKALKEEMAGYRKHIFDELRNKIPFESAFELILIVSVKDLGDAAKELMESYPIEIREKIANTLQNFDSFKAYLKEFKGECEELTPDEINAIEQYHKIFGTYKTKENFEIYENAFQEARKNGELSEDVARASAMGIGEAAYANINMTSDEKETFIQKWVVNNNDILSDSDMAKVEESAKKYITELLDKNPEIKNNFNYVKKNIKEIVEKTLNRIFDEKETKNKEISKKEADKELTKILNAPSGEVQRVHKEVLNHAQQYIKLQAAKFEIPTIEKTPEQIGTALLKGIIDEELALKNLDNSEHKFIKMCIRNPKLASMYDERIKFYIKSESEQQKLKELAAIAPHNIVLEIVKNMRGNKEKLTEELIKKHEVDFDTTVMLKNYTEKIAV